MMVLDTHALVWWVTDDVNLSKRARSAIEREAGSEHGQILVSAISAWEISLLIQKDRLSLSIDIDDWLNAVAEIDAVQFVPVDRQVAVQSTRLPGVFHADPADRMIVALARHVAAPLVTADQRIRAYAHVKTVW